MRNRCERGAQSALASKALLCRPAEGDKMGSALQSSSRLALRQLWKSFCGEPQAFSENGSDMEECECNAHNWALFRDRFDCLLKVVLPFGAQQRVGHCDLQA